MERNEEPKKGMRLFWIVLASVLVALFGSITALYFIGPSRPPEPEWITEAPLGGQTESLLQSNPPIVYERKERAIQMPFREFVDRLNRDFPASKGWKFTRYPNAPTATWEGGPPNDQYTVVATGNDKSVAFRTIYTHELSTGDKLRRWLQGFTKD